MIYTNGELVNRFEGLLHFDNTEPVTLKLKPTLWSYAEKVHADLLKYCKARSIDYVLFPERGTGGNYHLHGIIVYPFDKVRKNFTRWFNKFYGHIYHSDKGEAVGWYNYCTKGNPFNIHNGIPYLFDPLYEPQP